MALLDEVETDAASMASLALAELCCEPKGRVRIIDADGLVERCIHAVDRCLQTKMLSNDYRTVRNICATLQQLVAVPAGMAPDLLPDGMASTFFCLHMVSTFFSGMVSIMGVAESVPVLVQVFLETMDEKTLLHLLDIFATLASSHSDAAHQLCTARIFGRLLELLMKESDNSVYTVKACVVLGSVSAIGLLSLEAWSIALSTTDQVRLLSLLRGLLSSPEPNTPAASLSVLASIVSVSKAGYDEYCAMHRPLAPLDTLLKSHSDATVSSALHLIVQLITEEEQQLTSWSFANPSVVLFITVS